MQPQPLLCLEEAEKFLMVVSTAAPLQMWLASSSNPDTNPKGQRAEAKTAQTTVWTEQNVKAEIGAGNLQVRDNGYFMANSNSLSQKVQKKIQRSRTHGLSHSIIHLLESAAAGKTGGESGPAPPPPCSDIFIGRFNSSSDSAATAALGAWLAFHYTGKVQNVKRNKWSPNCKVLSYILAAKHSKHNQVC